MLRDLGGRDNCAVATDFKTMKLNSGALFPLIMKYNTPKITSFYGNKNLTGFKTQLLNHAAAKFSLLKIAKLKCS